MLSKCCFLLILLIVTHTWHVNGRFVDNNADGSTTKLTAVKSSENSLTRNSEDLSPVKELTDEEIQQMKSMLANELTPLQIDELEHILNKFKQGTTTKDHVEGMVKLIVFAVAVKSNATDIEITKLFDDNIETTTIDAVILNQV